MYYISKKVSLIVLALTALTFARSMFWFFDDPEGPNLLVVGVATTFVYFLSLVIYVYGLPTKLTGLARLLSVVIVQILIVAVSYLFLK